MRARWRTRDCRRTQGAMDDRVWRRLADYPHIAEVHVSANAGRHDTRISLLSTPTWQMTENDANWLREYTNRDVVLDK